MKNTDLRIGNWVSLKGCHKQVVWVKYSKVCVMNGYPSSIVDLEDIKPIPLTEEIILRCGFEINGKYCHSKYIQDSIKLIYDFDQRVLYFKYKGEFSPMIQIPKTIEHLHELQNVIHALIGQELKIEL